MPDPEITNLYDIRDRALQKAHKEIFNYYATGAGVEQTLEDSVAAFKRFRLQPRIFRSDLNPDLSVSIQGHRIRVPFGIAPTAAHATAHPDGESATAKAAQGFGTIMIQSSMSQTTIEDVRRAAPNALLWMQTYFFKDRRHTLDIVRRAERQGFKAIVVTVDSPVLGLFSRASHYEDYIVSEEAKMRESPLQLKGLANLNISTPDVAKAKASGDEGLLQYSRDQIDQSQPKWKDVAWLKTITHLPIILKGIITAESAREAVAAGVQGIIVSAHGGRQLDGLQAPIEALPAILDAVRGSKVEVYMDGGIRSGRDVFKAIALGAKAVFMGRPIIWGLIHDGATGVRDVLQLVEKELSNTMSLCGCNKMSEVTRQLVAHESKLISKL
ncbi:2-Hydroxyacid oxidase 1-like isoform X1 [Apostichopus japonicus]|uniref:2-Hydroxyacid oxidase 1-like isoform X1 n=1 Tax=Stichopus japonicus TaxID=307972 RepID=UPI003AB187D3